ncbi:hypothetical protein C8R44DRAFT_727297 [Mycena epipterygia]|nr:hypothetical protein C8R44DRAFT_727297 [Mycena epipterygia]
MMALSLCWLSTSAHHTVLEFQEREEASLTLLRELLDVYGSMSGAVGPPLSAAIPHLCGTLRPSVDVEAGPGSSLSLSHGDAPGKIHPSVHLLLAHGGKRFAVAERWLRAPRECGACVWNVSDAGGKMSRDPRGCAAVGRSPRGYHHWYFSSQTHQSRVPPPTPGHQGAADPLKLHPLTIISDERARSGSQPGRLLSCTSGAAHAEALHDVHGGGGPQSWIRHFRVRCGQALANLGIQPYSLALPLHSYLYLRLRVAFRSFLIPLRPPAPCAHLNCSADRSSPSQSLFMKRSFASGEIWSSWMDEPPRWNIMQRHAALGALPLLLHIRFTSDGALVQASARNSSLTHASEVMTYSLSFGCGALPLPYACKYISSKSELVSGRRCTDYGSNVSARINSSALTVAHQPSTRCAQNAEAAKLCRSISHGVQPSGRFRTEFEEPHRITEQESRVHREKGALNLFDAGVNSDMHRGQGNQGAAAPAALT